MRMTGRGTQALDARYFPNALQEARQRPDAAVRTNAVIGVDVLSDQGHLAHAGLGERFDFGNYAINRTRQFGATRIGHDTKRTKLVAAFLHRDEGASAARAGRRRGWRCKSREFVIR